MAAASKASKSHFTMVRQLGWDCRMRFSLDSARVLVDWMMDQMGEVRDGYSLLRGGISMNMLELMLLSLLLLLLLISLLLLLLLLVETLTTVLIAMRRKLKNADTEKQFLASTLG